jgi:hypothetical protein
MEERNWKEEPRSLRNWNGGRRVDGSRVKAATGVKLTAGVALTTENQWREAPQDDSDHESLQLGQRAPRRVFACRKACRRRTGLQLSSRRSSRGAGAPLPPSFCSCARGRCPTFTRHASPLICSASREMGWTSAGVRPARGLICKKKDVQWVMHKFQT